MADFITAHKAIGYVVPTAWKLFFDGSACVEGSGIRIVLFTPRGQSFGFSFRIGYGHKCSNSQAEYEALLRGPNMSTTDELILIGYIVGTPEWRITKADSLSRLKAKTIKSPITDSYIRFSYVSAIQDA